MSKLKPVDFDKALKALAKIGYRIDHRKGSHIVVRLVDKSKYASVFGERRPENVIVVPAHRPIGRGMMRTIMREADLSVDEFYKLLD